MWEKENEKGCKERIKERKNARDYENVSTGKGKNKWLLGSEIELNIVSVGKIKGEK